MTRKAEWIPIQDLKPGDWIADPYCGQPGRVKSIDTVDGSVIVNYLKGPPGRIGFTLQAGATISKLVKIRQKAAKK
jgi:hypothetical protein